MSAPLRSALLADAVRRLSAAGVPDAARDARLALRWASGLDGAALAAALAEPAGAEERSRFAEAVQRRSARVPLSHITGRREFWGRSFSVGPDVLDPRPETETLIAEALVRGPFRRVLDLGTGSGCILLTLLAEWPQAQGLGTDISPAALARARSNSDMIGVTDRARLLEADWTSGVAGGFDLVVSNPPYVAESEMAMLEPEVRGNEPRVALTPGGDGLGAYKAIAGEIGNVLAPRGVLMVEIGATQSDAVSNIFSDAALQVVSIAMDLDGHPRVIVAQAREI